MSRDDLPTAAQRRSEEAGRRPFTAVVVDARGADEAESLARAASTLRRWRRTGLSVAVVCSRHGMNALPDHELVELVVDQSRHGRPDQESTVRLLGEAILRLDAAPLDTLVVAQSVASVAAAQALGFRRIVGVERDGDAPHLIEAGARSVVDDLRGLRFPRSLPDAMQCLPEISRWRAGRSMSVFLDYDGTITPIVGHPADAWLGGEMRATLAALSERCTVALISGRDRQDVQDRVAIDGLYYAGNHGLDISGPDVRYTPPGAEAAAQTLEAAAEAVGQAVAGIEGVVIETKRYSVAVHYRQAPQGDGARVANAADETAARFGLATRSGKQVRELIPALGWHKGRAVAWLRDYLQIEPAQSCLVYVGDDETDEDAFRALGTEGIGLRPGPRVAASLADFHLADTNAVQRFLSWLPGDAD